LTQNLSASPTPFGDWYSHVGASRAQADQPPSDCSTTSPLPLLGGSLLHGTPPSGFMTWASLNRIHPTLRKRPWRVESRNFDRRLRYPYCCAISLPAEVNRVCCVLLGSSVYISTLRSGWRHCKLFSAGPRVISPDAQALTLTPTAETDLNLLGCVSRSSSRLTEDPKLRVGQGFPRSVSRRFPPSMTEHTRKPKVVHPAVARSIP
jgi:hypothetical protein